MPLGAKNDIGSRQAHRASAPFICEAVPMFAIREIPPPETPNDVTQLTSSQGFPKPLATAKFSHRKQTDYGKLGDSLIQMSRTMCQSTLRGCSETKISG